MKWMQRIAQSKHFAVYEACLIGLAAGLAAYIVKHGVAWLGAFRVNLSFEYNALLVLVGFGVVGGLASGALVQYLAPEAAGSGIPQALP